MSSSKAWTPRGEWETREDERLTDIRRSLYPDLNVESTFSPASSNERTIDFELEEIDDEEEEHIIIPTKYARHSTSRLSNFRARSRSSSRQGSPNVSHNYSTVESHDIFSYAFDYLFELAKNCAIFIIVSLICVIAVGLFYKSSSTPALKELPKTLRAEINAVTLSNFGGDRRVKSVLQYIFEILLVADVKAPVVVLLVGYENKTDNFLKPLKRLLNDYHKTSLDLEIPLINAPTRRQLEYKIFGYLSTENNRAVIMRRIDHLASTTPLLLHAICDPDTAPYKQLLLIATLSPPNLPQSVVTNNGNQATSIQRKECDEHITNYLTEAWSSELHTDKTYPIISRISAILLCLV